MLGAFRKQAARAQDEPIPEDLIASLPVLGPEPTHFAVEHEEPIPMPPPAAPLPSEEPAPPTASMSAALAQQLRYELGEALARELDRGAETIGAAMAELEARLAQAEADLAAARAETERERHARESAERRVAAFKELALR